VHRILVIDDSPPIGEILKVMLAAPDRLVLTCTTGAGALEILEDCTISLILLDLMLPDMNGRKLLEMLRQSPTTAGIPVIVMSATDDVALKIECFALGIETFFVKPFDPKTIAASVTLHTSFCDSARPACVG